MLASSKCGIVGLLGSPQASREAFVSLTTLQHRGQDAAGILTFDQHGFHKAKNIGLVEHVFDQKTIDGLTGDQCIGHTRYGTAGRGDVNEVQPFVLSYPYGIGMVHNGNIINFQDLAADLKKNARRSVLTRSDTEVLLNLFAWGLEKHGGGHLNFEMITEAFKLVAQKAVGSYSVVTLIAEHGLVAFRDPDGIRPLVIGKRAADGATMVASESAALEINGFTLLRSVAPGEVVWLRPGQEICSYILEREVPPHHCMFEWVYFASPDSVIETMPVYRARLNLGTELAPRVGERLKQMGLKADVVIPVPETSRIAAIALAETLDLPYRELLIKNRYIKRTFILATDAQRRSAVNLKLSPVRSEIQGKNVILVDDSIVRGTTSRRLIELVRSAGAAKVFFVSTCPPIQHPCYYGIDFPNEAELLASNKSAAQIEEALGADAVIYLDRPGLERALNNPLCMACLTGRYPTKLDAAKQFSDNRAQDRGGKQ